MSLAALLVILAAGGALAWWSERFGARWPRRVAVLALLASFVPAAALWHALSATHDVWFAGLELPWIPRFGIALHLRMDGLSLIMVALTLLLGLAGVVCSWSEIRFRTGFFHFNLLLSLAGAVGVFVAFDLFLFFLFWELMLIPMYFLISIWGHEGRARASMKFFLFTQAGGLLMLAAILGLAIVHYRATGTLSFDYFDLLGGRLPLSMSMWLLLGFLLAFAVKLPVVPLHTWLPDAHTEAPTAGSVILAGVLLKTGAYGMLRFALPLFPRAALEIAPAAMALGVVGIVYGAWLAFAQTDLKRLIAYSSISHLGFVLLALFAWNTVSLNGAVAQMVAHGLTTGALFVMVGLLQERLGTRELARMGGLWASAPRLAALGLFFAVASLGMPGLANFVGEFLSLLGAFRDHAALASAAALGLVLAAVYSLSMVQRAFHGAPAAGVVMPDLGRRETALLAALAAAVVVLGVYPRPVLDTARGALAALEYHVGRAADAAHVARAGEQR